jgi:hypothetical protein
VEISCRNLLALLCLGCVSAVGFAADPLQLPVSSPAERALPIELDATWSELDRRNNRLVFRNLHITQGSLAISADEATADPADFEDSTWVFTGNVQIENAGLQAWCDKRGNDLQQQRTAQDHPAWASRRALCSRAPAAVRPRAGATCLSTIWAHGPSR